MRSCVGLLLRPKRARSTPTLAVRSSNKRIARPGQGKSKGYRTIIVFRRGAKAFFMYGFAKSHQANINDEEAEASREARLRIDGEATRGAFEEGDFILWR